VASETPKPTDENPPIIYHAGEDTVPREGHLLKKKKAKKKMKAKCNISKNPRLEKIAEVGTSGQPSYDPQRKTGEDYRGNLRDLKKKKNRITWLLRVQIEKKKKKTKGCFRNRQA